MAKKSNWLVFFLVAIAQFMVVLDTSITNVALPAIKSSLHFSQSSLQWVITAYALTFGGFLLLGGRAADLFGRRRTLLAGMGAFTAFSLLIGLSQSETMLIALRALQGVSAAFMSPAALSIVLATFKEGKERNRALGLWTTVATGGAAVGLLLGGFLTEYINWRWNFFINVPVGIAVGLAIRKYVPLHEGESQDKHLDLPGATLVTAGLISAVFAISQAPTWGWLSGKTLGVLAGALALILGFVFNEARLAKHPLMPLSIFKIRNVSGANLMMAPLYAGMMGMFFLTSLYLQSVLGYASLKTGLSFLPFPIILGIMSTRTPKLVGKYGFKPFLIAGPLVIALGVALLSRLPVDGNYLTNVLPTVLIMPIGIGLTFMPLFAAATTGVPVSQGGLASGLLNTSQQMGGALGLAILSGVAASVTKANAHLGRAGALVQGYDRAFSVAVGFMLVAAALAALVITQRKKPSSKKHGVPVPAFD
jgi:EmrB/QacA subfamily drug resistance transporter